MKTILPPNQFNSVASPSGATDEAAASSSSHAPAAAAEFPAPSSNEWRHRGAPAVDDWNPETAGATDCIGEIFAGAAKLEPVEMWFENTAYPREDELLYEVLQARDDPRARDLPAIPDEQAFWEAIEPMPIFIEQMRA
jgi:hypothetical protein